MKTSFLIAKTHLLAKKKQTIVAMLGVTFGIAMFIFMRSFMTGSDNYINDTMLSSTAHVRLYNDLKISDESLIDKILPEGVNQLDHPKPADKKKQIRHALQILDFLKKDQRVYGVSPLVSTQVFFNYGPQNINATLTGLDILAEDKLFNLRSKMKAGQLEDLLSTPDAIIVGSGMAKKMNLHVGDKVQLTTPRGVVQQVQIVGILQMGVATIDNVRCLTNLKTVQTLLGEDSGYITDINMKIKDMYTSGPLAQEYARTFACSAEDWQKANATILVSVKLRAFISIAVSFTLLIVAGFGIYNIMNMTIMSKMKDIAILKAAGFSGRDVMAIFMIESVTIGLLGALLGLVLGFLMSYAISKVPFDGGDYMALDHLPVNFSPVFYIQGVVFGMLTTALAGWFPSKKAAKVDPVTILRG